MSTYVFMKVLESAPSRYDRGIRILTFGRVDAAYDRVTSCIEQGQLVLDIGCGTGALTLRAATAGAHVVGIDINPQMLDVARTRVEAADLADNVEFREQGVVELSNETADRYDVVMSGLCFSELTENEQAYALGQAVRILRPGGLLVIADETRPRSFFKSCLHWLIRIPLTVITYILTQTTTRPVRDLPAKVTETEFITESVKYNWLGNFIEMVARKPTADSSGG